MKCRLPAVPDHHAVVGGGPDLGTTHAQLISHSLTRKFLKILMSVGIECDQCSLNDGSC